MDIEQENKKDFKGSIAIGPLVGLPSSDWVGEDIANYLLKKGVRVQKFGSFDTHIEADFIIVVKLMPEVEWLLKQSERGCKVLYAPVDTFHSSYVYWLYKARLRLFSGYLLHNDRLGKLIAKASNSPQFFIEHYLKYQVEQNEEIDKRQEILWVGHLEYIPSLVKYTSENNPKYKIRVLSDLEKLPYYENYLEKNLCEMGYKYFIEKVSEDTVRISGVLVEQWSEMKQDKLMRHCVAAFDTKMDSFGHNFKPPTKAQMFIYNKIPFACSEYSFSFKYFKQRGLRVAKLNEINYLMSDEYRDRVVEFSYTQLWRVKIERVASSYLFACEKSILPTSCSSTYLYLVGSVNFIVYLYLRVSDKLKQYLIFKI